MRMLVLALPLLLLACAEPVTRVQTVDDRPRLLLTGAPDGAVLFLDGRQVGPASAYGGQPGVLLVEPGTHIVEIRVGDRLLLSRKVFFGGGEQRRLDLSGETKP